MKSEEWVKLKLKSGSRKEPAIEHVSNSITKNDLSLYVHYIRIICALNICYSAMDLNHGFIINALNYLHSFK